MEVCGIAITWIRGKALHFEVLVEDKSGSILLGATLEKILRADAGVHTWRIHHYRGLGRIPGNMQAFSDPTKRMLLNQLPRLLRGYGKSLQERSVVIVVVDLDDRDCNGFKQDMLEVLSRCNPRPQTLFRIAIEESEAWLLGDRDAVKTAYPCADESMLDEYIQDSICGTWEFLADCIHPGGAARLKRIGYPETGRAKCEWAARIAPHMEVDRNRSKSFQVFRDSVRLLAGPPP